MYYPFRQCDAKKKVKSSLVQHPNEASFSPSGGLRWLKSHESEVNEEKCGVRVSHDDSRWVGETLQLHVAPGCLLLLPLLLL